MLGVRLLEVNKAAVQRPVAAALRLLPRLSVRIVFVSVSDGLGSK